MCKHGQQKYFNISNTQLNVDDDANAGWEAMSPSFSLYTNLAKKEIEGQPQFIDLVPGILTWL